MKRILWTTRSDLSVGFFDGWEVDFYEDGPVSAGERADTDIVYFRDPFNSEAYLPRAEEIDRIIADYGDATSVDHVRGFAEMRDAEDKYLQAKRYGELMPKTRLGGEKAFVPGKDIAKKRISQRAKDVLLDLGGRVLDEDWIIQERLDIAEELRVYAVKTEIVPTATIKSSKQDGKVKVVGVRRLREQEIDFARKVAERSGMDFIGMDIAVLDDGTLRLIEVNRSPQFKRYSEMTGVNLAEMLTSVL